MIGQLIRNMSYLATGGTWKMTREIKRILIDLSGTLHVEDVAIEGSIESLKRSRII